MSLDFLKSRLPLTGQKATENHFRFGSEARLGVVADLRGHNAENGGRQVPV